MNSDQIVVGAGIGGVAAALLLARQGCHVILLERSGTPRAVGAGIGLAPNACALLDRWGILGRLQQRGRQLETMTVCTRSGRPLSMGSLDVELGGKRYSTLGVHRAVLLEELLIAAQDAGVELRFGQELVRFEEHEGGASVVVADGTAYSAGLLIGADGIHSRIRAQLHGDQPPRYAGYTCLRGVARGEFGLGAGAVEAWGRGQRFGFLPIGEDSVYWFAVKNAEAGTDRKGNHARAELLASFGDSFSLPHVRALIEATPAAEILHNDIMDRPPLNEWGRSRATLLGDAAHAMTPNLGQGACQAIEDAAVLAAAVDAYGSDSRALREYEARRIPRVNPLIGRSAGLGKVAQLEHPILVALRDAAMRLLPSRTMHTRMARELEAVVTPLLSQGEPF